MHFIESKNGLDSQPVKLSYCDYGRGKPVVLIHGWPMSKEMWEYQFEPLVNAGLRVIAYDRRGFGKSDKPWDGYNYDTLAGDLKSLLEQLDLNDVTLVGFSMGGGEVARYFSKYGGKRVSKAILVSSVLPCMQKKPGNEKGVPKDQFDAMLKQLDNDRAGFLEEFGRHFFGVNLLNHRISSGSLESYRMLCSFGSSRAIKECLNAFAFTDFREDLSSIHVPTLVIHGKEDAIVPVEFSSDKAVHMIQDYQYIKYDDAPHGLFFTHKQWLNRDIISFITKGRLEDFPEDTALFPANESLSPFTKISGALDIIPENRF
jgi:pimeloyl-ACP methyl ester carboxylesterase